MVSAGEYVGNERKKRLGFILDVPEMKLFETVFFNMEPSLLSK